MKKTALLLLLPALILSSCGDLSPAKTELTVNYKLRPMLSSSEEVIANGYNLTFTLKDNYFETNATTFNKDIALLSKGKTLMAESELTIRRFYSAMEFDKVVANYPEHTEDTIQYAIAHKKINNFDLISIAVNGHYYGLEWKNNALLGKEGDHEGFSARANDIYAALKDYISTNSYSNYKLWITGYSRGGAISNILSHYILSKDELNIAKENMFVYTFEAPKGLLKDNAPKYENVFNIIYSGDTVTYLVPEEYGFARCGIDIDLYTSSTHTDEVIYEFDKDISIPAFSECKDLDGNETLSSEQDVCKYFFAYLSREGDSSISEEALYIHTREEFVDNVQSAVQFVLAAAFFLPNEVKQQLLADVMELGLEAISLIYDPVSLAIFIAPYLFISDFPYTAEQLFNDCTTITRVIKTDFPLVLSFIQYFASGDSPFAANLIRSFMVHCPEVGHALLKDYLANLE